MLMHAHPCNLRKCTTVRWVWPSCPLYTGLSYCEYAIGDGFSVSVNNRITSRLLFRGLHYIEAYGEIVEAFKIVRCIKGVFF